MRGSCFSFSLLSVCIQHELHWVISCLYTWNTTVSRKTRDIAFAAWCSYHRLTPTTFFLKTNIFSIPIRKFICLKLWSMINLIQQERNLRKLVHCWFVKKSSGLFANSKGLIRYFLFNFSYCMHQNQILCHWWHFTFCNNFFLKIRWSITRASFVAKFLEASLSCRHVSSFPPKPLIC